MELGLTKFITKIFLYTEEQKSFGTIRKARYSSLNNLWPDSIKINIACSVRHIDNFSIKMTFATKG